MKKPFLILFGLIISVCVYGQSNITVMDISITPKIELDSISGLQTDTTIAKMYVSFKVNHVKQADKAYILYGTSQNQGDIRTVIADFVNNAGLYELSYNGNIFLVNRYTAITEITLTTSEENDYNYITVYVSDNSGNESNRIYFTK